MLVPFSTGCPVFCFSRGISGSCCPHLSSQAFEGVARLDSLSVRCLSSYLIFWLIILVTSRHAASQARPRLLFVRRFSPSP
jgi:hypothetical protein